MQSILIVDDDKIGPEIAKLLAGIAVWGKINIKSVWSPKPSLATSIANVLKSKFPNLTPDTRNQPINDQNLPTAIEDCLKDDSISIVLVALPPPAHIELLKCLYNSPSRIVTKHILSLTLPTLSCSRIADVRELFNGNLKRSVAQSLPNYLRLPPVWNVLEPARYESVLNKILNILPDIGTLLSVQLLCSGHLREYDTDETNKECSRIYNQLRAVLDTSLDPNYSFISSIVYASAFLRRILGAISSLSGSTVEGTCPAADCAPVKESAAAVVTFASGISANILWHRSGLEDFDLTFWGVDGRVRVMWLEKSKTFECKREMSHFEHPSHIRPTGIEWSLDVALEIMKVCMKEENLTPEEIEAQNLVLTKKIGNSPLEKWTDLATAEAIVGSQGVPVTFSSMVV